MDINVCEYVTIIDQSTFIRNEDVIKDILKVMASEYLFNDVGFTTKNYCNWGTRYLGEDDEDLVILDYGYLYPLIGQNMKTLFQCPKCGGQLKWNTNYTGFVCTSKTSNNERCGAMFSPVDIQNRMSTDFEDMENKLIARLNSIQMPTARDIEKTIRHN